MRQEGQIVWRSECSLKLEIHNSFQNIRIFSILGKLYLLVSGVGMESTQFFMCVLWPYISANLEILLLPCIVLPLDPEQTGFALSPMIQSSGSQPGLTLPLRRHWRVSVDISGCQSGNGEMLLAPSQERPGMM